MPSIISSIVLAIVLWLGSYGVYLGCNHGIAQNARLQQLLRYMVASLVVVLPLAVTQTSVLQPSLLMALLVAAAWVVAYPLSYHLTYRESSPDYDHQIDGAFGIYLFGMVSGLMVLLPSLGWLWGVMMMVLMIVPLTVLCYHVACHHVIDSGGMNLLQDTDYNEVIEFFRSYPPLVMIPSALSILALSASCVVVPTVWPTVVGSSSWWQMLIVLALVVFMAVYLWKPRHGLFVRTGMAQLYRVVREYVQNNSSYADKQRERLATLTAEQQNSLPQPHTILMVIGESASRDYMSAFTQMAEDTTPWMRSMAEDSAHCFLFANAYSCDIQTVPTLEKALTEYNQYDGGQFYTSCSIVDMAHSLGYHVHWYSNQGHLGAADTPITLVANTADVARWTRQEIGKAQYDGSLISFLDEIDPKKNNLVVLHLMGSHFNYENRFTEDLRQWGQSDDHDRITNYKNSLYYTDHVLQQAYVYCCQKLNLQAMVYCSDHAEAPDHHRMPNFGGYLHTRIPLMVWVGKTYASVRPQRAQALSANSQCYWTNDLLYELMCGLMDAKSNRFVEENSLASPTYRFVRKDLTTMSGKVKIADDPYDKSDNEDE